MTRATATAGTRDRRTPPPIETHPFSRSDEVFRASIPSVLAERHRLAAAALAALARARERSRDEPGRRPERGSASAGEHGRGTLDDRFSDVVDRFALDETIVNAILHGNRQDPSRRVEVRVFLAGGRWGFEVADEGEGFDWRRFAQAVPEPLDLTACSGHGLALIRACGAELCFLRGGRSVVIVRSRPAAAATGDSRRETSSRPEDQLQDRPEDRRDAQEPPPCNDASEARASCGRSRRDTARTTSSASSRSCARTSAPSSSTSSTRSTSSS